MLKAPVRALVIGVRTLSDGEVDYDEDGRQYHPTKHYKALLVVADLRRKPFFVEYREIKE